MGLVSEWVKAGPLLFLLKKISLVDTKFLTSISSSNFKFVKNDLNFVKLLSNWSDCLLTQ